MNLIDSLHALNQWWSSQSVDSSFLYRRKRSEFSKLTQNINSEKILALIGPKGCGKTALFYQVIDHLIRQETSPNRVILFTGDEPSLFIQTAELDEILKVYVSSVLHEGLDTLSQPVYIFIDEVHRLPNWRHAVERLENKHPMLRFILSAPTKGLLFPVDGGALLSRSSLVYISPLSPSHFNEMHSAYRDLDFDNITCKSLLPARNLFDNPRKYVRELLQNIDSLFAFQPVRTALLHEYLLAGGYPGYFACDSMEAWHRRLTDELIDLSLFSDILRNYAINTPEKLKLLLYLAASESGREQSFAQIGKTLSLNTTTAINLISLLREGGYLSLFENYSDRKESVSRKNKRLYLRDGGLKNALLRRSNIATVNLEDEIRQTIISMAASYAHENGGTVYFWRNRDCEADIVIDKGYSLLPISVILKSKLSKKDIRGLNSFGKTFVNRDTLVITEDLLDIDGQVCYLPYWLL